MPGSRLEEMLAGLSEPLAESIHVTIYGIPDEVTAGEEAVLGVLGRFLDLASTGGRDVSVTIADRRGTYTRDSWERICGRALMEDRPDVIAETAYPDRSHFWLQLHPYLREAVAEVAVTVGLSPTSVWSAEQVAGFARELAGLGCFIFGVTWCRYSHPTLGILTKYDTFRPAIDEASMYTADGLAGPCGFGPNALRRYVLGPAWGLLLSAGHVRALGGSDAVRAAAPVAAVRNAGEGIWLEVTELPNDDDILERLDDVERFLDALIPSVDDVRAANGGDPALGSGRSQPTPPLRTRSWRRDVDTP